MSGTVPLLPQTSTVRSRWEAALINYLGARATSDEIANDSPLADKATDEACEAMDALIEATAAPDLAALKLKVDLAAERAGAFAGPLFDDHTRGIISDIHRLAEGGGARDPHAQWLADRNRIYDIANRHQPMADGLMDALTAVLHDLEERIRLTPATTGQGWAAKAAVLLQLPSEGFDASEQQAGAVLDEAVGLLGIVRHQATFREPETSKVAA